MIPKNALLHTIDKLIKRLEGLPQDSTYEIMDETLCGDRNMRRRLGTAYRMVVEVTEGIPNPPRPTSELEAEEQAGRTYFDEHRAAVQAAIEKAWANLVPEAIKPEFVFDKDAYCLREQFTGFELWPGCLVDKKERAKRGIDGRATPAFVCIGYDYYPGNHQEPPEYVDVYQFSARGVNSIAGQFVDTVYKHFANQYWTAVNEDQLAREMEGPHDD